MARNSRRTKAYKDLKICAERETAVKYSHGSHETSNPSIYLHIAASGVATLAVL